MGEGMPPVCLHPGRAIWLRGQSSAKLRQGRSFGFANSARGGVSASQTPRTARRITEGRMARASGCLAPAAQAAFHQAIKSSNCLR